MTKVCTGNMTILKKIPDYYTSWYTSSDSYTTDLFKKEYVNSFVSETNTIAKGDSEELTIELPKDTPKEYQKAVMFDSENLWKE